MAHEKVKIYNSTHDGHLSDTPVDVSMDGRNFQIPAGGELMIKPGESITLPTRQYHSFWGKKGGGKILLGEVSQVNDDQVDNRFKDEIGRFPEIDEDEPPLYLLGNEYSASLIK